MQAPRPPRRYPIECFPPSARAVIEEHALNDEAALATIGCSLIGALSGAIQNTVDVERSPGWHIPCAVNTLVIAGSSARKTTVDRRMTKVFKVFEVAALQALKPQIAEQKAKHLVWKGRMDGLQRRLKKDTVAEEEAEEIQFELENLLLSEPQQVAIPRVFYKDATPEAIAKGLSTWPSILLTSSEAGALLGGRTTSNLGFLSGLWDGDAVRIDRVSTDSYQVDSPRLTISLMVQEKTLAKFLNNQGNLARDNGFLARFLVCFPEPMEGTRFGLHATGSRVHHDAFQNRLMEILMSRISSVRPCGDRKLLKLSSEASVALKNFADAVELALGSGGALADVKDSAGKVAENAVRLAGLFHVYEDLAGPISYDTMMGSIQICDWHLIEFQRLFGHQAELPLEMLDAIELEKCIQKFSASYCGAKYVPKKYLFSHAPKAIRTKARLDMALHVLAHQGKLNVHRENKTYLVYLNPAWFPAVNQNPWQHQIYQGKILQTTLRAY